jgi:3'(2'), 5'-bisphosphate nucleotidase
MPEFPSQYLVAMRAAVEAANEIMRIYERGFEAEFKTDGSPVTEADLASSKILYSALQETGIPIIGEEKINLPFEERNSWTENWCVDPLDGTKEFLKRNGEFCINIAHVVDGKAVYGIIADPCVGRMIVGGKGKSVYIWNYAKNPEMTIFEPVNINLVLENAITWIGSRSHESADAKWVESLTKQFNSIKKIPKGSAIKFFDLAIGEAHIYPRFAPTMEWDIAAGQAILEELGGTVISVESGKPLTYNKESLFNPFFVAKTAAFIERENNHTPISPEIS